MTDEYDDQDDYMQGVQNDADDQGGLQDLEDLKAAGKQVPDTAKDKDLRACTSCNLILSYRQWSSQKLSCPNCREIRGEQGTTRYFTGMVSLMMVTKSWVAKYNKMKDRKPGVYAIRIMQEDYYDELDAEDDEGRLKKAKKRKSKSSQFKQPDKYSDDASGYYSEDEDEDDDDDMF